MKSSRNEGVVPIFGVVVIILLVIAYEMLVWRQCLAGEPWWYCLRILARG